MSDLSSLTSPSLRRLPTQQRARDRVERVLDAADRLLAEEGIGALGTKPVALEAGVSIGSLYFWFPDKESIAQALALRYWDELAGVVAEVADRVQAGRLEDPVGAVVNALAAGFRARPGFLALWFDGLRTERLREATRPVRERVAADVARGLSGVGERPAPPARLAATARMVVLVGDGILREAFRVDREGDPFLLQEGARVLRAYINDRLEDIA